MPTNPNRSLLLLLLLILLVLTGCDAFTSSPDILLKRTFGMLPNGHKIASPAFDDAMKAVTHSPRRNGNKAMLLLNGSQVFPAMLADIRSAKREILICTYIFSSDRVGTAFAELLAMKARNGVQVKFLYDSIGSIGLTGRSAMNLMKKAGAQVRPFNPLLSWTILRINNRLHSKILVIDEQTGYTAGLNLSEKYDGGGRQMRKWRDSAIRVQGPVVTDLRRAYMHLWEEGGRGFKRHRVPAPFADLLVSAFQKAAFGDGSWPPPNESENQKCLAGVPMRVIASRPGWFSHEFHSAFLLAIQSAEKSIDLTYGYFLPDHAFVKAIILAMERGVRIRIILPDKLDIYLTKKTSLECSRKLCRKGIKLYAYRPALLHCKTMVIDGVWSTIGSANVNGRSFYLNYECNITVLDRKFAARMTEAFERDLRLCRRLSPRDLRPRNPLQFIVHNLLYIFKGQL